MSYTNTFITVAEDCPVTVSEIPTSTRAKKPLHLLQYEVLMAHPYMYGHEALIFEVHLRKEGLEQLSQTEKDQLWDRLFSKGHPCLRASALTKRYGFGAHYDEHGKIALYPMESETYQNFVNDPATKKLSGMRNTRKA